MLSKISQQISDLSSIAQSHRAFKTVASELRPRRIAIVGSIFISFAGALFLLGCLKTALRNMQVRRLYDDATKPGESADTVLDKIADIRELRFTGLCEEQVELLNYLEAECQPKAISEILDQGTIPILERLSNLEHLERLEYHGLDEHTIQTHKQELIQIYYFYLQDPLTSDNSKDELACKIIERDYENALNESEQESVKAIYGAAQYIREITPKLRDHFSKKTLLSPSEFLEIYQELEKHSFAFLNPYMCTQLTAQKNAIDLLPEETIPYIESLMTSNNQGTRSNHAYIQHLRNAESNSADIYLSLLQDGKALVIQQALKDANSLDRIPQKAERFIDALLVLEFGTIPAEKSTCPEAQFNALKRTIDSAKNLSKIPPNENESNLEKIAREKRERQLLDRFTPYFKRKISSFLSDSTLPQLLSSQEGPGVNTAQKFLELIRTLHMDLEEVIQAGQKQILEFTKAKEEAFRKQVELDVQNALEESQKVSCPEDFTKLKRKLDELLSQEVQNIKLYDGMQALNIQRAFKDNICQAPFKIILEGQDDASITLATQLIDAIKKEYGNVPKCSKITVVNPSILAALDAVMLLAKLNSQPRIPFDTFLKLDDLIPLSPFADIQPGHSAPLHIKALGPLLEKLTLSAYEKAVQPENWTIEMLGGYLNFQNWVESAQKKGLPSVTILIEFPDEKILPSLTEKAASESRVCRLAVVCDKMKRTLKDGIPPEYERSVRRVLQVKSHILNSPTPSKATTALKMLQRILGAQEAGPAE